MSAIERLGIQQYRKVADAETTDTQNQTKDTFSFKWSKRDTYESKAMKEKIRSWLFEKYCNNDPTKLDRWLNDRTETKIILDAGCGVGLAAMLFFGEHINRHDYLGVDISDSVDIAKERFAKAGYSGDFLMSDLMNLRIPDKSIDMIFSEGVMHHTDSTELALKSLAKKLRSGGRFLFYVYAKKAPIREFTDDHIRMYLKDMSNEEAWEALKPLTKLGMNLWDLGVMFDVEDDIPFLGIKKGRHELQRFFYWHICKLFHNSTLSFDEMNHINFDYFRPLNCHRHTPGEIIKWCKEADLTIENIHVEDAGITVVAIKN